jgi:hypothetical protein
MAPDPRSPYSPGKNERSGVTLRCSGTLTNEWKDSSMTQTRAWFIVVPAGLFAVAACGGGSTTPTPEGGANDTGTKDSGAAKKDSGGGGHDSGKGGNDSGRGGDTGSSTDGGKEGGSLEGGDAGTFSVKTIPGLALWLNAGVGVTTVIENVTIWADQSGNGNDASSTDTTEPSLVASDINSLPGVHFTGGTYLSIPDSTSLQFGTNDFLIAAVVEWTGTDNGIIFSKQESTISPYNGAGMFANWALPTPSTGLGLETNYTDYVESTTTGLNDGKPRLVFVQRVGTTLIASVAGVAAMKTVTPADDSSAVGFPAVIGANTVSTQALTGDIAEIVAVGGTITASNQAGLVAYLDTKYGL